MSGRIGVGVGRESIRAVLVRRGAVVWAAEAPREPGNDLRTTLESVLGAAPRRRIGRWRVAAAVGPHGSQVKQVHGLPPTDDPTILAAVVRESASAFFLRNGAPLATTGVRPISEGVVWAAAIEAPIIEAVRDACRTSKLKLISVLPAAVALPLGILDESFRWSDGELALEVTRSETGFEVLRRTPRGALSDGLVNLALVEPLASLGEDAPRFADAYGAAVLTSSEALTIGFNGESGSSPRSFRGRLKAPALIGVVALAVFLTSPMAAVWTANRAETALRELHASERWSMMETALAELGPVTQALDEIDAFTATRPERTRLIASIANTLPDGAALLSLEVRPGEGQLTALVPNVESLLSALLTVASVDSVTVVGRPAPERVGGGEMQRAAVRFRLLARGGATQNMPGAAGPDQ